MSFFALRSSSFPDLPGLLELLVRDVVVDAELLGAARVQPGVVHVQQGQVIAGKVKIWHT